MILVDTSIWIDHLHRADPDLVAFLGRDEVGCHTLVIAELALGSMKQRETVLGNLARLRQFPVLTHHELMVLVENHRLWGRGLSAGDAHLLGSVKLVAGARLWTRDKRLRAAAREIGVDCFVT